MQHQRAVFAEELDLVTGAEKGCAAHRQADHWACRELQRHRDCRLQLLVVRQSRNACGKADNRPAEPFEIVEAMRDEIAKHATTIVADRLPAAHARLDGTAFDVPMHRDMPQRADRICIDHGFGALPGHDLMEVEVDHRRLAARARLLEHGTRGTEIARQRFFRKNRLAQLERANRDLRLQAGQRCDGDRLHVRVLDQGSPVAISLRRYFRRGQIRRSVRHCCRRAQSPRSGDRHGKRAVARCARNCSRLSPIGSRLEAPRCRNLQCSAWIWAKSTCYARAIWRGARRLP